MGGTSKLLYGSSLFKAMLCTYISLRTYQSNNRTRNVREGGPGVSMGGGMDTSQGLGVPFLQMVDGCPLQMNFKMEYFATDPFSCDHLSWYNAVTFALS